MPDSFRDLNLRSLPFIKAIALNRMDLRELKYLDDNYGGRSSFKDEMAFLLEEME